MHLKLKVGLKIYLLRFKEHTNNWSEDATNFYSQLEDVTDLKLGPSLSSKIKLITIKNKIEIEINRLTRKI